MGRMFWLLYLVTLGSCTSEPEFSLPMEEQPTEKQIIIPLIDLEAFEDDDHGWSFEVSHPRSLNIFDGARSIDRPGGSNHAIKIERLPGGSPSDESYYDYALWRINFQDLDLPLGTEIRVLAQIKLEYVFGTGVSIIINAKRRGVRLGFVESGWINGNGRVMEFGSHGTLYSEIKQPIDEIEVVLKMEPLTFGAVYFDDIQIDMIR